MFFRIILIISFSISSAFAIDKVFDTQKGEFINYQDFINNIPQVSNVVLGEYHYNNLIQASQGKVINDLVTYNNLENKFTVGWEFLSFTSQDMVNKVINDYKRGIVTDETLFKKLFPQSGNYGMNNSYLPIFKAIKLLNGDLIAVNAPREIKRKLIKEGMDALDPIYQPPDFELGGENYYQRFKRAMQQHVPPHMIGPYYTAQCFTDSVMAWKLIENNSNHLAFLVVGSFHTDYNDGVVVQIKRISNVLTITIKFVDVSEMSDDEINEILEPSPEYGYLADYIFLTGLEKRN